MWLLNTFLAFCAAVAAHAVCVRCVPRTNRVVTFIATGAVVGLALLIATGAAYGLYSFQLLASALCYAFACELYVFLFTLALSSISANLLARLHGRPITDAEVESLYDSRRMVSNRVRRLIDSGFLKAARERVELTDKGESLLKWLGRMRRFFGHDALGPSGR